MRDNSSAALQLQAGTVISENARLQKKDLSYINWDVRESVYVPLLTS